MTEAPVVSVVASLKVERLVEMSMVGYLGA